ncbi:MAG: hypothetical protein GX387_07730 [Clostridium sp.]|jgi:hypothetical protein|nr:hypothetical protein [Clostridium sp.]
MEYLENAFKFWGRHKLLIVPLFILICIMVFMGSPALNEISSVLNDMAEFGKETGVEDNVDLYGELVKIAPNTISLAYVVLLGLLLGIFILPATYGMIIKGYETGTTSLGSFFTSLKKYFAKFIPYFFGVLLFMAAVIVIYFLILIIFPFIYALSWQLGLVVFAGIIIASVIIVCLMFNVLNVWFIAVAWDGMKIFEGFFKAFELLKSYFWSSIGIAFSMGFLYVTIIALIGGALESIFVVSCIVRSFLLSIFAFVLMVFGFELYRDRTDKKTALEDYL